MGSSAAEKEQAREKQSIIWQDCSDNISSFNRMEGMQLISSTVAYESLSLKT